MRLEKRSATPELEIGDGYTFIREGILHKGSALRVGDIVSRQFTPGGPVHLFRVTVVHGPSTVETVFIGFEPDEPQDAARDPRGRGPDINDAIAMAFASAAA